MNTARNKLFLVCHLCVAGVLFQIRSLLQLYISFHHGFIKLEFKTDNYSRDIPIDFILSDIFLNTIRELLYSRI